MRDLQSGVTENLPTLVQLKQSELPYDLVPTVISENLYTVYIVDSYRLVLPTVWPRIPACTGGAFRNIRREAVSLAVAPAPRPCRALGALKGPAELDPELTGSAACDV